jgi:hypothetical protein
MAAAPSSASASRGAPGEGPVTPVAGLCTSRAGEASICIRGGGTVLDFAPNGAGVLADGVPVAGRGGSAGAVAGGGVPTG